MCLIVHCHIVLEKALEKNFAEVAVEIVDNPDFTQDPFNLASTGISGEPIIIEYGNDKYLLPLVDKSKIYDLVPMIREIEVYKNKTFYAAGAGAGELIKTEEKTSKLNSHINVFFLQAHLNGSIKTAKESTISRSGKTEQLKT